MATIRETIKGWFETNDIPTQAQFYAWIDSFWHMNDSIPIASIEGLQELIDAQADQEAFDNHLTDPDAHAELFAKAKVFQIGEFAIFKAPGNSGPGLEPKDIGCGLLPDGNFVPFGQFIGGAAGAIENWETSPMEFTF